MSKKIILIRIILIFTISINLVNNIHRQKEDVRNRYLIYVNQEFDKDLQIRKFAFQQLFVKRINESEERHDPDRRLSRGGSIQEETFILTFYTSLNEENGYGPVTCNGSILSPGIVANNILSQGTKIITREFGELVVADKGGVNFDTTHRLDVFISRRKGENDYQYKKRVNSMGKVKVKGYIIK
jgi:3D (Asp-Asp-Asp) domain-containing protein